MFWRTDTNGRRVKQQPDRIAFWTVHFSRWPLESGPRQSGLSTLVCVTLFIHHPFKDAHCAPGNHVFTQALNSWKTKENLSPPFNPFTQLQTSPQAYFSSCLDALTLSTFIQDTGCMESCSSFRPVNADSAARCTAWIVRLYLEWWLVVSAGKKTAWDAAFFFLAHRLPWRLVLMDRSPAHRAAASTSPALWSTGLFMHVVCIVVAHNSSSAALCPNALSPR